MYKIKCEDKSIMYLNYTEGLSVLDKNTSEMNEFLRGVGSSGGKKTLRINVKKTKSLRLGINEGEEVILDSKISSQDQSS